VETVPAENPSFLAVDPTLTHLYSVNENLAGRVSAYAIDRASGKLAFLNTRSANGKHTTHLSVHPSGRYLLAANYTSGDVPVFPIQPTASLAP
jgi:6-phosphogluconolactonase